MQKQKDLRRDSDHNLQELRITYEDLKGALQEAEHERDDAIDELRSREPAHQEVAQLKANLRKASEMNIKFADANEKQLKKHDSDVRQR